MTQIVGATIYPLAVLFFFQNDFLVPPESPFLELLSLYLGI